MDDGQSLLPVVVLALALFVLVAIAKAVSVVPVGKAGVVERFGKYKRTLEPGLAVIVPFVDRIQVIDRREQVHQNDSEPIIAQDNQIAMCRIVLYYQVVDPKGRQIPDPQP